MRLAQCLPNALSPAELGALQATFLQSPLLARNTLAGSFQATRGFGVTFTSEGQSTLEKRWPALTPFLQLAQKRHVLTPWFLKWRTPDIANAFYLNVLLLKPGAAVAPHVDGTLRGPSGNSSTLPLRVTVLYLNVPDDIRGGQLSLQDMRGRGRQLRPRRGALVHFRGDLTHAVLPFRSADPNAVRASLVLEQYRLGQEALARLPPMRLESKAGFLGYLQEWARH